MTIPGRYAIAAIVAAAVALAGCGSSGSSKPTTSSGGGGSAPSAQISLTTYHGPGYEFSVPKGWLTRTGRNAGTGKTVGHWQSRPSGAAQIDAVSGSQSAMGGTVDQQVTQYLSYNRTVPRADRLRITVSRVDIPGAKQALLTTARGQGKVVHYGQTLTVQTTAGTVIYLSANRFAGDASFDPSPIIKSFKLTG